MPNSVLITVFSQGLGLIALLAVGFGIIERLKVSNTLRAIIHGIWFGAGAIFAMTTPAEITPGVLLDVRSIVVGMAAAFCGPVAAIIVAVLAASYRLYLGGVGAIAGTLAIALSAIIGCFGLRYLNRVVGLSVVRFALLGFVISLTFASVFVLGIDTALPIIASGFPIFMMTSIVAGALLGSFMAREQFAIQRERQWQQAAMTDAMTGLPNRRRFEKIATRHMMNYSRSANCSLLVLDIDHFKKINDDHGHLAGDQVIQRVAAVLQDSIRPSDITARIGGEEFAVLLLNVEPAEAFEIAERIRQNVEAATILVEGITIPARVSIGGLYGLISSSYEENFKIADMALYRAKKAGRNKVVFSGGSNVLADAKVE